MKRSTEGLKPPPFPPRQGRAARGRGGVRRGARCRRRPFRASRVPSGSRSERGHGWRTRRGSLVRLGYDRPCRTLEASAATGRGAGRGAHRLGYDSDMIVRVGPRSSVPGLEASAARVVNETRTGLAGTSLYLVTATLCRRDDDEKSAPSSPLLRVKLIAVSTDLRPAVLTVPTRRRRKIRTRSAEASQAGPASLPRHGGSAPTRRRPKSSDEEHKPSDTDEGPDGPRFRGRAARRGVSAPGP